MSVDSDLIRRKFEKIGARVKTSEGFWFTIDIENDRKGEYFDITLPQGPEFVVEPIDVRPRMRHLLLLVKRQYGKDKFLCGHDERHWFAAAVPERGVSTVETALDALKPDEVRRAEQRKGVRMRDRLRRRNAASVRQGEWFFLPRQSWVEESLILRNQPLSRAEGSKPHVCEELYRSVGLQMFVSSLYPNGLFLCDYRKVLEYDARASEVHWWTRPYGSGGTLILARGRVWHPDHKTIFLDGWHEVLVNTERQASGRYDVRFMD
jgi:hypothetical protein